MDESLLVPEVIPDFGQAEFTTGARGGALLTYHSKKYPGKVFHFKIYGQSSSQRRYFACKGCMDMKKLYGNIVFNIGKLASNFQIAPTVRSKKIAILAIFPSELLKNDQKAQKTSGGGATLYKNIQYSN